MTDACEDLYQVDLNYTTHGKAQWILDGAGMNSLTVFTALSYQYFERSHRDTNELFESVYHGSTVWYNT